MVICESLSADCPPKCCHSKPHEPVLDVEWNEDGTRLIKFVCNERLAECWWRGEIIKVICGGLSGSP